MPRSSRSSRTRHKSLTPEQHRKESSTLAPLAIIILVIVGFLLFTYQPGEIVSLRIAGPILGLISLVLIMADLRIGVVILTLIVGLSPEVSAFGFSNFRIEDFFMPLLLFGWIAEINKRGEGLYETPLKSPILWFLGASTISSLLGIQMGTIRSVAPAQTTFTALGKMYMYFLMFVIVMNSIRSREDVKIYVIAMVLANVAVAFLGVQDMQSGIPFSQHRIQGPYGEGANILGGYFIFHISLMVGLFMELDHFWYKMLLLAGIAVTMIPFVSTFSRTAYVALIGGLLMIGVFKRRGMIALIFFVLIILPLMISNPVLNRAATILDIFGDRPPSSWEARVSAWKQFIGDIIHYPIFGHGVRSVPFLTLDNVYMQIALDSGLVGLFSFLWLMYRIAMMGVETLDTIQSDNLLSGVTLGYLAGFAGLMTHGLGATTFLTIRTMEPFMIATGILAAIWYKKEEWLTSVHEYSREDFRKLSKKGVKIPSSAMDRSRF